jgi:hypothetical protein
MCEEAFRKVPGLGAYLGDRGGFPKRSLESRAKRVDHAGSFTILADNAPVWQGINAEAEGIVSDQTARVQAADERRIEPFEIALRSDDRPIPMIGIGFEGYLKTAFTTQPRHARTLAGNSEAPEIERSRR